MRKLDQLGGRTCAEAKVVEGCRLTETEVDIIADHIPALEIGKRAWAVWFVMVAGAGNCVDASDWSAPVLCLPVERLLTA